MERQHQVRHFLRRALEQEFRQMGDADVPKELQVLQQKFKMILYCN